MSISPSRHLIAAGGLALLFQGMAHALPVKALPPFEFDKAAYEKRLHQAIDGKVMGFEAVLIKNGQVVAETSGGLARNNADGKVKMSTVMPANIGSVIKFTGGVALLNLFESKDKTINPKGYTVEQWLEQPIYKHFPALWQHKMDASIKKITFRHLLRHRSGFRSLSKEELGPDEQKRMFDYLAAGIDGADFDKRKYANANFSLVTYLIPMIAHPDFLERVNDEAATKRWSAEGPEIHKRIADAWEAHMHGMIYQRITPAIKPSCNPTVEFAKIKQVWAPDYTSVSDDEKGTTRDSRATNGYCQAQGGWYMEGRDLAAFVANFSAATKLVSSKTRDQMYDDDKADDRVVWSFTIKDADIAKKFNLSQLAYMGGDHGGAHASVLMLPNGYYAIGIINSNDMNSYGVTQRLLRAFKTGIGMPEDARCPGMAKSIAAADAAIAPLQAAYKEAQSDHSDAVKDGIKGGHYAAAVKAALAKVKAAQAKAAGLRDDAENMMCMF